MKILISVDSNDPKNFRVMSPEIMTRDDTLANYNSNQSNI